MEVFIKREMQRKGINNRQLAAALGVGDSYASGISRGDKNLSMNTLQQVADVLQVPVWRLLAPEEVADAPSTHSSVIRCPNCGHEIKIKVEQ